MGFFKRTPSEKRLEELCCEVGNAAGLTVIGRAAPQFVNDVAGLHADEIRRLHAEVVSAGGERASRRALHEAQMTAQRAAGSGGPRAEVASKKLAYKVVTGILESLG